MAKPLPDKEDLWRIFHYDSDTGKLTSKVSRGSTKIGDEAGTTSRDGYRRVSINRVRYLSHRIIFKMITGRDPIQVDHINGNPYDNRWENLRECTQQQNNCNRKSKTDIKGVTKTRDKFRVRISVNKQQINVGTFNTLKEAIEARNKVLKEHHGEFVNYG